MNSGGSGGKESACNAGDLGSIPESGRSPGEGKGYPLQYSCLENPMGEGAWRATVHGVAQSDMTEATYTFNTNHSDRCSPPLSSIQTAHFLSCIIWLSGFYLWNMGAENYQRQKSEIKQTAKEKISKNSSQRKGKN